MDYQVWDVKALEATRQPERTWRFSSLPSTSSDNGWATVDHYPNFESYQQAQSAAIFNPGQTLHLRTHSESSQSDGPAHTMESFGSFEDISNPYSPYSPASDTYIDLAAHRNCYHGEAHHHSHEIVSPAAAVAPVPIKMSPSSRTTPSSTSSPPARRNSAPRKSPTAKATKPVIRRTSNGKKGENTEKRVGRRRGPLLPEQRKQASEIRKLRACLRCKFLKKTCDKGEPCAGLPAISCQTLAGPLYSHRHQGHWIFHEGLEG